MDLDKYFRCPHCGSSNSRYPILLSPMQQKIFNYIWDNPGCSRSQLEIALYGSAVHTNLILVHLSKIRTAIFDTPFQLQGSYSSGYRITVATRNKANALA